MDTVLYCLWRTSCRADRLLCGFHDLLRPLHNLGALCHVKDDATTLLGRDTLGTLLKEAVHIPLDALANGGSQPACMRQLEFSQ